MTATTDIGARITADEYQVLLRYANGQTIRQIAAETGAAAKAIHTLIEDAAAGNRGRALKLVDEYEQEQAAAVSTEDQPAAELTAEEPEQQADSPAETDGVVELLDAAVATGDIQLVEHAEHIRSLIRDLQTEFNEHAKMRAEVRDALTDEAIRIENRLAEIRAQLAALGGETT